MLPSRCLLLCLATLVALTLPAQDLHQTVLGSAGGYFSAPGAGNLHFTLGEIAVERTENGPILERGFHYGLLAGGSTTAVWAPRRIGLRLTAFPNPTDGRVTVTGDWRADDRIELRDVFGRLLLQRAAAPSRDAVDLSPYPAGTYFLTLTRAGRPVAGARLLRR